MIPDISAGGRRVGTAIVRAGKRRLTRSLAAPAYWTVASWCHRFRYRNGSRSYEAPLDPFKLLRFPPESITQYTGRVYPPWRNRRQLFGTVQYGPWDRRSVDEIPRDGGPPPELFLADQLSETLLYRALEQHFVHDVAWEETEFVSRAISLIGEVEFPIWHFCASRSDVLDRCHELDRIYDSIEREGTYSQIRHARETRDLSEGFLDVFENEILIDIGRDGEPLLVSGKHRLFLSRIAGVQTVPVGVVVRHADWMETREDYYAEGKHVEPSHPDLQRLTGLTNR